MLIDGTGAAFTDKLKHESEAAQRFHTRARPHLLEKYGREDHPDFLADDRFVKTLLLAALAPDVPALRRLTGARLAALNHGSVRSRTVPVGRKVIDRMRALQGEFPTELRAEGGESDPVFSLHLSDLDIEPLLDAAAGEDKAGVRRVWLREELGVRESRLVPEKEIIWRGTRRTAEFVFGNVRDPRDLSDEQFTPATQGNIRFVIDYPFDDDDKFPTDDYQRVGELTKSGLTAATLVWLPDSFSEQRKAQLGRLMRINFLLERDRLADYTRNHPPDDRAKARAFSRKLAHWTETASQQATGGALLIEDVLTEAAAPLAREGGRPLILVLDGMSADVAVQLAGELDRRVWTEVVPKPRPGREAARQAAVSMLPSVTTISRASLLCGRPSQGGQSVERS